MLGSVDQPTMQARAELLEQPSPRRITYIERHLAAGTPQKVDWEELSRYYRLSDYQVSRWAQYLNWRWITFNQVMSVDFIQQHHDRLDWQWMALFQDKDLITALQLANHELYATKLQPWLTALDIRYQG